MSLQRLEVEALCTHHFLQIWFEPLARICEVCTAHISMASRAQITMANSTHRVYM